MTGQLMHASSGGPDARCKHCGTKAVGPCASCHEPLCADCCVITDEGAKPWAICRDCDAGGHGGLRRGWWTVVAWIGGPILVLALAVALLGWLAGCDPRPPAPADTDAGAPRVGLADPRNDHALVAAVRAARDACAFSDAGGHFMPSCKELRALRGDEALATPEGAATLVAALFDPDERLRSLAAQLLAQTPRVLSTSPDLAARVLRATREEQLETTRLQMAHALGRIDPVAAGLAGELAELLEKDASNRFREHLLGSLGDEAKEALFDSLTRLAKVDGDAGVRLAAVSALWTGLSGPRHRATCLSWLDRAEHDEDPRVAAKSGYFIVSREQPARCTTELEPWLTSLESRAEAPLREPSFVSALERLADRSENAELDRRAIALARRLARGAENDGLVRAEALQLVVRHDPEAKVLATELLDDPDPRVRATAERATQPKPAPPPTKPEPPRPIPRPRLKP
ncbi:MAG: hypothetical protein R3B72_13550 [Polyangiaceae bacterium]